MAGALLATPTFALAQDSANEVARDESAFVVQAPATEAQAEAVTPQAEDATSKVYFPDAITPEAVANARSTRAAQLEQANSESGDDNVAQVSPEREGRREVAQLSDGDSARVLAQLSNAERQVLLQAVEGTDICERSTDIAAIQALCDARIETRSAEFTPVDTSVSAEDRLLGGELDSDGIATLESAIARLARNTGEPDDFSNQVIASVALNNGALSAPDTGAAEGDPTGELSAETQAVVNAIVQQLSGN